MPISGTCRNGSIDDDVLVVNDTRVFPARLTGHKDSGGKVELLLHHLPEAEDQRRRPRCGPGPGHAPGAPEGRPGPELRGGIDRGSSGSARSRGWPRCASPAPAAMRWPRCWRRERSPCRPISSVRPRRGGPGDLSDGLCGPGRGRGLPHRRAALHRHGFAGTGRGASRSCASPCTWGRGRLCRCVGGLYPAPDAAGIL